MPLSGQSVRYETEAENRMWYENQIEESNLFFLYDLNNGGVGRSKLQLLMTLRGGEIVSSQTQSGISLHLRWVHRGPLFTKSALSPLIVHDLVSTWNALQSESSKDRSLHLLCPLTLSSYSPEKPGNKTCSAFLDFMWKAKKRHCRELYSHFKSARWTSQPFPTPTWLKVHTMGEWVWRRGAPSPWERYVHTLGLCKGKVHLENKRRTL